MLAAAALASGIGMGGIYERQPLARLPDLTDDEKKRFAEREAKRIQNETKPLTTPPKD